MPTPRTARSAKPPRSKPAAPKARPAPVSAPPLVLRESDAVVKAATARTWAQWFRILDRIDLAETGHDELVLRLARQYACPRWWRQRIIGAHAEARGHQPPAPRLLAANTSRTLAVPVADLWRAWQGRAPAKWLASKFKVQRANEGRSLRLLWPDATRVEVYFWPKGERRSQVNVMHRQLADPDEVARKKAFWVAALDRLRALLE